MVGRDKQSLPAQFHLLRRTRRAVRRATPLWHPCRTTSGTPFLFRVLPAPGWSKNLLNELMNELRNDLQNGLMMAMLNEVQNDLAMSKKFHLQLLYPLWDKGKIPISKRTRVCHKQAPRGRATPPRMALYIHHLRLKRVSRRSLLSLRLS